MAMNFHSNGALLVVLCFIVSFIATPSSTAGIVTQCSRDSECDINEFCLDGMCESCVPCEWLLNREGPHRGRRCAKNEDECGSCLPGYQAEELTSQRRSYKCLPDDILEAVRLKETTTWGPVILGTAFFIALCLFVSAAYCYQRGHPSQAESPEKREEAEGLVPSAPYLPPPPYSPMDQVDEDDDCRVIPARSQIFEPHPINTSYVGATPLGPYHRYCEPLEVEPEPMVEQADEEVDFNPVLIHEETNDTIPSVGSTETIPSQWEPGSVADVSESPIQMPSFQLYRVRSQSFEHLPFFARPEHAPADVHSIFAHGQRSQSNPEIMSRRRASSAGETYAHRHVRLASHRSRNNQGNEEASSDNAQENGQVHEVRASASMPIVCDTYEADSPSPFAYADSEEHVESAQLPYVVGATFLNQLIQSSMPNESSARTSQDSGFFDPSQRRRPPNEQILEFGFAVYAKRSRRD